jgi:tetraacyldisaccharide 4'-kinase
VHPLEKHWQHLTMVSIALLPLSGLFCVLAWLRRAGYRTGLLRKVRVAVPVVVVGNLSVGGTGKTPVVIWLARSLRASGYTPGVISRGYGGSGQLCAVDDKSSPQLAGDEPVLIARLARCPVWVGRDRAAAAARLLACNPEVNVVISDDGLQHYRLERDCELAVISARQRFGNGLLLPAGPLRESPNRLRSVDAVIVNGEGLAQMPPNGYRMQLEGHEFHNLVNAQRFASPRDFDGMRLHAVAGIGDPERFFLHLRGLGLSFEAHAFPDHHAFSPADLAFPGCDAVLMTQKDAIKCAAIARENWWALPVAAHIDGALLDLVKRKIGSARGL